MVCILNKHPPPPPPPWSLSEISPNDSIYRYLETYLPISCSSSSAFNSMHSIFIQLTLHPYFIIEEISWMLFVLFLMYQYGLSRWWLKYTDNVFPMLMTDLQIKGFNNCHKFLNASLWNIKPLIRIVEEIKSHFSYNTYFTSLVELFKTFSKLESHNYQNIDWILSNLKVRWRKKYKI